MTCPEPPRPDRLRENSNPGIVIIDQPEVNQLQQVRKKEKMNNEHKTRQNLEPGDEPVNKQTEGESMDVLKDELHELKEFIGQYMELSSDLQQPHDIYSILKYRRDPDRKSRETSYQYTLRYFLDPNKPHGFGKLVLSTFLNLVDEKTEESFPYGINHIKVDTEVHIRKEEENPGRIDLVIADYDSSLNMNEAPNWVLFIELKVAAPEREGQTSNYARADKWNPDWVSGNEEITDRTKTEYLFVKAGNSNRSYNVDESFTEISWAELVGLFSEELTPELMGYPTRSVVQFTDFVHSLREVEEMGTNEAEKNAQEDLVNLYLEKRNIIQKVEEAKGEMDSVMSDYLERLFENWEEELINHLDDGELEVTDRYEETHDQFPDARSFKANKNTWFLREGNNGYLQIFRENWIDEHSKNDDGPVLYFFHRARKGEILSEDGERVKFGLRIRQASTKKRFRNAIINKLEGTKLEEVLKKKKAPELKTPIQKDWNVTTNNRWKGDTGNLDNDITNYYPNLARLLADFIGRDGIIEELDEALEETRKEYENTNE